MPALAHEATTAAELGVADAASTASAASAHATSVLLLPGTGVMARAGSDPVLGTQLASGMIPHLDSHAAPGGDELAESADNSGGFDHRAAVRPQVATVHAAVAP